MSLNASSVILLCFLIGVFLSSEVLGQDRKIKAGDILEIVVYGEKELTKSVLVEPNGTVDYPFIDGLPVDGMNLEKFETILTGQLARHVTKSPVVSIRFTESYPIRVTILGQVAKPGVYLVPTSATMQGAIGAAGGPISGAQLAQVKLIRSRVRDDNDRFESTNGRAANGDTTIGQTLEGLTVNMESFYLHGDPSYLPQIKEGDTIVVPGFPTANAVKVLGSVRQPGSYEVPFRTGILDVIFMAGGPTEEANMNNIKLVSVRVNEVKKVKINIKKLSNSKNLEDLPYIEPGDVVYIPKAALTWKKFLSFMRDITVFATLYVVIRQNK